MKLRVGSLVSHMVSVLVHTCNANAEMVKAEESKCHLIYKSLWPQNTIVFPLTSGLGWAMGVGAVQKYTYGIGGKA